MEDKEKLDSWQAAIQQAILVDDLKGHDGIRMIIDKLQGDITEINELLLNADSKSLADSKRDRVLDQKKLYEWFLGFFQDSEENIKFIENQLTKEEDFLEKNKNSFSL